MTKRMAMALASCLALTACGGGSSSGNAAASKTFTYGAATTYGTSSLDMQLSGAVGLGSGPDATSAQSVASVDSITAALLGSSGVGLAMSPTRQEAFAAGARAASRQLSVDGLGGFDDPACVTTTASSVVMKGCSVTTSANGETMKVLVNGSVTVDPAKGTLVWDYTVSDSLSYSGISASANLHESGTLTATATTLEGQMLADLSASGSSGAQSISLAVSEAAILDLTYADAAVCSTRVTGGTLEAKRVFTDRSGLPADQYPDRAALITWTGCGTGSAQYSWK